MTVVHEGGHGVEAILLRRAIFVPATLGMLAGPLPAFLAATAPARLLLHPGLD